MMSSQLARYRAKYRGHAASHKLTTNTLADGSGRTVINLWAYWTGGSDIEHRCDLNDPAAVNYAAHWAIANHATFETHGWHEPITEIDQIRRHLRPNSTRSAAHCAAGRYGWDGWHVDHHQLDDGQGEAWVIRSGKRDPFRIIRYDARLDRAYEERIAYAEAPALRDLPITELLDWVVDAERIHWIGEKTAA